MSKPIRTFAELESIARSLPPVTVAVAGAADREVLGGALLAVRAGLARALLVGDEQGIGALLAEMGERPSDALEIVAASDDTETAARAVALVSEGRASVLLKGMVSTGILMRAALSRENGLRYGDSLLSDVLVCPNPLRAGRPFLAISDGGLNVAPDLEQKKQILRNALRVLWALGHESPAVAVLCASEKVDKAMPATADAKAIAEAAAAGDFGRCRVEGPLSLDVALSREAAEHKGVASRVAGACDLLLAPTVEAGNLFAKALYLAGRLPVAHVIAGARAPILINSRNDSAEDRFRSILLAVVVAGRSAATPLTTAGAPTAAAPTTTTTAMAMTAAATSGATPTATATATAHDSAAVTTGASDTLHVLALNPGATSTKLALYRGLAEIWREDIAHADSAFKAAPSIFAQLESRLTALRGVLERRALAPGREPRLAAVVGRGGLLPPLPGGTFTVSDAVVEELRRASRGEHASNLGAPMARALGDAFGCPAYIVDPVCVDELREDARLTGWPGLERESLSHALNLRAVARRVAAQLETPLASLRLIGIHMGSGISMAAFEGGRMVDIVNPRDEGPISADRPGALPTSGLAKLVISEGWSVRDSEKRLGREAGLAALVGTRDLREVRKRATAGDRACKLALDAVALGVAKWALWLLGSLDGVPDRFFITGGMAHDGALVAAVRPPLERLCEVVVVPGEDEILALVEGALRAVSGAEPSLDFATVQRARLAGT